MNPDRTANESRSPYDSTSKVSRGPEISVEEVLMLEAT